MKKFFAFLAVSAALVACGGKTETSETSADTTATVVEMPAVDSTTVADSAAVAVDSAVVK